MTSTLLHPHGLRPPALPCPALVPLGADGLHLPPLPPTTSNHNHIHASMPPSAAHATVCLVPYHPITPACTRRRSRSSRLPIPDRPRLRSS